MLYCIKNIKRNVYTAGAKAPNDISEISRIHGAKDIIFYEPREHKNKYLTYSFAATEGALNWLRLLRTVKKGDIIIFQHPNENIKYANRCIPLLKKKGIKTIVVIHDLMSLRKTLLLKENIRKKNRDILADQSLLKKYDYIIAHNSVMIDYLIKNGFDENKLINLGIFDYLHNAEIPNNRIKEKSVVVAGNLMREKCQYVYKLIENQLNFDLYLYGSGFSGEETSRVHYMGRVTPEELPGKLKGSFGLVWDGNNIDKCSGNAGEYIKYNNPHKCSLYIASNLPVIVWKEAALASFVEENGVGIVVDSLLDIGNRIDQIADEEYSEMLNNVKRVGTQMRNGEFYSKALESVLSRINDN